VRALFSEGANGRTAKAPVRSASADDPPAAAARSSRSEDTGPTTTVGTEPEEKGSIEEEEPPPAVHPEETHLFLSEEDLLGVFGDGPGPPPNGNGNGAHAGRPSHPAEDEAVEDATLREGVGA
jgi:hypothetical protein